MLSPETLDRDLKMQNSLFDFPGLPFFANTIYKAIFVMFWYVQCSL